MRRSTGKHPKRLALQGHQAISAFYYSQFTIYDY